MCRIFNQKDIWQLFTMKHSELCCALMRINGVCCKTSSDIIFSPISPNRFVLSQFWVLAAAYVTGDLASELPLSINVTWPSLCVVPYCRMKLFVCPSVCYTGVLQCTTEADIDFRFGRYIPCIVDASVLVIVYITSSLQKPLHTSVIVLEKDNTPFNYPILNYCSLKTVS